MHLATNIRTKYPLIKTPHLTCTTDIRNSRIKLTTNITCIIRRKPSLTAIVLPLWIITSTYSGLISVTTAGTPKSTTGVTRKAMITKRCFMSWFFAYLANNSSFI
ncbi:hypothetical protein HanRHA438_Chr17g0814451 [Helianthus annuus]|nr:hypothetical protein HanRHA438_Chr17g0814451 [Helianthus annuus]